MTVVCTLMQSYFKEIYVTTAGNGVKMGSNWDFHNCLTVWLAPEWVCVRLLVNPSRFLSILLETSVTLGRTHRALTLSQWKRELPQGCLWWYWWSGNAWKAELHSFTESWGGTEKCSNSHQITENIMDVDVKVFSYVSFFVLFDYWVYLSSGLTNSGIFWVVLRRRLHMVCPGVVCAMASRKTHNSLLWNLKAV